MAINWIDDQLLRISLEYVQFADIRALLVENKDKVQISVDDIFDLDQEFKQWTDFYRDEVYDGPGCNE